MGKLQTGSPGRPFSSLAGHSSPGVPPIFLLLLICACLVAGPACDPVDNNENPSSDSVRPPEPEPAPAEMLTSTIRVRALSWEGGGSQPDCDSLDIFLFSATGLRKREYFRRMAFQDTVMIRSAPGDKIVALVSDSPLRINTAAVTSYDVLEQLKYSFCDDNPSRPLRTAQAEFEAGSGISLQLKPLMCRVVIVSVINDMSLYKVLECPRAYLSLINPEAEAFRQDGFSVTSQSTDTLKVFLPCDIGMFPQYPATELFCYPNDAGESFSNPSTVLTLEGEVEGKRRSMTLPLPSLYRGSSHGVEFCFDDNSYSAEVLWTYR